MSRQIGFNSDDALQGGRGQAGFSKRTRDNIEVNVSGTVRADIMQPGDTSATSFAREPWKASL